MAEYKRSSMIAESPSGYCPGCLHALATRLVSDVLDELGQGDNSLNVISVGCSALNLLYWCGDNLSVAHGRAPAAATGIKRTNPERLVFEGLEIDMAGREVYVNGQKANMTPKEYDLLFYLVKNRNLALTRDQLLEEVWGYDFFGDDRTVDTHIKMLRNSLGEYRKFIVTLRGTGYKFEA